MSGLQRRFTPFMKQCFVTCGMSLNMMQHGLIVAYSAILLNQLRETRFIAIDDSSASWIASINGFGLFIGILITPILMSKFGRRDINLVAATIMTGGWAVIHLSTNLWTILAARFCQGISAGFTAFLCSVLIGEYASPKYRGIFLTTVTTALLLGVFVIHTAGLHLAWKTAALVPMIIGLVDIIIIFNSPESPTYLATKGRYDECKKVFHWLRGSDEYHELQTLLHSVMSQNSIHTSRTEQTKYSKRLLKKLKNILITLKTKEFYKPIIIMMHLHMINLLSGGVIYDCFGVDIYRITIGSNVDIASVIISIGAQSTISNLLSIIIISKFNRRTVLLFTTLLNIAAYAVLAAYIYAKVNELLNFDYPFIGILLGHFHTFSYSIGPLSIPNIIDGEIFPTKYKGIGGAIFILFFAMLMTLTLKVTPFLFSSIGIYGTYSVFAVLVCYGLIVTMFILPETKDKTLQDIEKEFRVKPGVSPGKDMSILVINSDHVIE